MYLRIWSEGTSKILELKCDCIKAGGHTIKKEIKTILEITKIYFEELGLKSSPIYVYKQVEKTDGRPQLVYKNEVI